MTGARGLGDRRQPLRLSSAQLVATRLPDAAEYPLLVEPRLAGLDLVEWAADHRVWIDEQLVRHGALLFRGFHLPDAAAFARFVHASSHAPMPYTERSSPRQLIADNIYTSTSHPAEHEICLHNEQSYNLTFPARICFYCITPAAERGATPIASTRRVLAALPPALVEPFAAGGYRYVRNFGSGVGLSWQTAFQTGDRAEVERYAAANQIELEWLGRDRLRTRQVRRCLARHPHTGELLWFNHLTFFHPSTLPPGVLAELRGALADDELGNHTCHGDGSPIEPAVMDTLRAAYLGAKVTVPWQRHDCLLLDNLAMAHGRESYRGERSIATAMSEPRSWSDVAPRGEP